MKGYFFSINRKTANLAQQGHVLGDWNHRLNHSKNLCGRIFEYVEKGNFLENIGYCTRKFQATRHFL